MDGTLWDSRASIVENWNEVLSKFNLMQNPIKSDDIIPYMGLLPKDILKDLFPRISDETIESILIEIAKNENKIIRKHGGKLYNGVKNTLFELKTSHDLYIVSNCQAGYIESFLEYFGFEDLFIDFLSHGETNQTKDLNLRTLMRRNGLDSKTSVYIGDTSIDFEAAQFNDLEFIFCNYGFGNLNNGSNGFQTIQSFEDLLNIV